MVWQKDLRRTVIGVGMIPRGEVGLIFAQIGLSTKLLSGGLYSAVALMVMLTTFITPPLLRRLLVQGTPGKSRRRTSASTSWTRRWIATTTCDCASTPVRADCSLELAARP